MKRVKTNFAADQNFERKESSSRTTGTSVVSRSVAQEMATSVHGTAEKRPANSEGVLLC